MSNEESTRTIKIDGDKLKQEFIRRGISPSSASKEIGFSSPYLSLCIRRGTINLPAAKLLHLRYNIDMDLVKPDEIALNEEKIVKNSPEPDKNMDDLKSEISELKNTLKELSDDFHNYRVAMLQYMKKFENHKKYGHF